MIKALISSIAIGSLLFAGFGLIATDHMEGKNHGHCPFETAGVADCSQFISFIDFATSHISIWSKSFSAVIIDGTGFIFLLLLLALWVILPGKSSESPKLAYLSLKNNIPLSFTPSREALFSSWFSLHEHSPSLF